MKSTFSKAQRTKQHIIEKAAPSFNKKGYADTSMLDIVEATGLTKGAIYGNFENKDDLALSVFEYNLSFMQGGIKRAIESKLNAVDKLLAMTAHLRKDFGMLASRGGCPILNAAVEADDNFPALKVKVKAALRNWKKSIIEVIERGQTDKTISQKIVGKDYAVIFVALMEGGIMIAKATDDHSNFMVSLDHIDHLIKTELKR